MAQFRKKPGREKREYDQAVVEVARVARVVKGGKRFRFRATVVIGNRRGTAGYAVSKGTDVSQAVNKAVEKARKSLITVPIVKDTIPHSLLIKLGAARILFKPAPPGTGVIAGGALRPIMELVGIKNISAKMLGARSKVSNVQACFKALKELKTPSQIASLRGKSFPKVNQNHLDENSPAQEKTLSAKA